MIKFDHDTRMIKHFCVVHNMWLTKIAVVNGRMNLSIVVLNFLYEWTTHTNQTAMLRSGHKSGQVKVLL